MPFHSPAFMALLVLTLLGCQAFPRKRRWILVAAGAVFYGLPNPAYLLLFAGVSLITYLCAIGQGRAGRRASLLFGLGLVVNAANLLFFKYALFFTRSLGELLGLTLPALDSFLARIVLPLGISFYTFQLVGYLIDVRRGRLTPARSLAEFWVFVSFFPKVVAGPIARGRDLLPQIQAINVFRLTRDSVSRGGRLLLLGLVKKIVLADTLRILVDPLFAQGAGLSGGEAWLAAYLFTFQIYLDFSAYSDMAVGVGVFFGLDLPQNFRTPYISAGLAEFWRRWHITLSSWIRDYVYIPLGGSRAGLPRQAANLMLAMAFSGLWHGAAWTFIVWGLYHGLFCVAEKLIRVVGRVAGEAWRRSRPDSAAAGRTAWGRSARGLGRIIAVVLCFHVVVVGWVVFRAADLGTAAAMLRSMLTPATLRSMLTPAGPVLSTTGLPLLVTVGALYILHLGEYLARRDGAFLRLWQTRVPPLIRGLIYALALAVVLAFVQTEQSTFIYSRF
jgi:alginate O-acetyltransferase complex protein AlgI